MQANRSRDTRPEMALRRRLHSLGLRYQVASRPLKSIGRTADLVFRGPRVAVFVDGCFWHRCPAHGTSPRTNADYWNPKLDRNVERDRQIDAVLADEGWLSVRVWEHEDPDLAAARVAQIVGERRAQIVRG